MTTAHTPTPWANSGRAVLACRPMGNRSLATALNRGMDALCEIESYDEAAANAAHIVACVNAHDGLVSRVAELEAAAKQMLDDYENLHGEGVCDCMPEPYNQPHTCGACLVRAALAKGQA